MQKKAEVKASTVKANEAKAEAKKPVEVKAAEVKEVAKAVEVKAAAKVEEAKETVKTAKTAAKKPVAKKVEKKEFEPEVFVQFYGNESAVKDVVERAKDAFVAEGHRASSIKTLKVYLKPEEYAAYYVINEKSVGRINLF